MTSRSFSGQVSEAGKLTLEDRPAFDAACAELKGKRVRLDLGPYDQRSTRANRRYWKVIVGAAGRYLSRTRDIPLSKEQVHYVLASTFMGCEETALGLVPKSTHDTDTAEFYEYCLRIEAWLAQNGEPLGEEEAA